MSGDLSFTSMMRPDTMLSAATRMISDRIRNITLLSTWMASKKALLMSCHGTARVTGPAALVSAGSSAKSASGSVIITSIPLTRSP